MTIKRREPRPMYAADDCCIHYTGVFREGLAENATCAAGVNYRTHVGGANKPGWIRKLPCSHTGPEAIPCTMRKVPTKEQVEAYNNWARGLFVLTTQAMQLCREDAAGKVGIEGTVKCPACGGTLRYRIARSNGHLHGACSKKGCLVWMQ